MSWITALISTIAKAFSWVPTVVAYLVGRRSYASDQKDKIIDIKTRQQKAAVDKPDRDRVVNSLRDGNDDTW